MVVGNIVAAVLYADPDSYFQTTLLVQDPQASLLGTAQMMKSYLRLAIKARRDNRTTSAN